MVGHLAALVFWAVLSQGQVTLAASDDLAAARALYAAGDYETALTRLAAARSNSTADEHHPASSPASGNASSHSPPQSGTTTTSAHPSGAH